MVCVLSKRSCKYSNHKVKENDEIEAQEQKHVDLANLLKFINNNPLLVKVSKNIKIPAANWSLDEIEYRYIECLKRFNSVEDKHCDSRKDQLNGEPNEEKLANFISHSLDDFKLGAEGWNDSQITHQFDPDKKHEACQDKVETFLVLIALPHDVDHEDLVACQSTLVYVKPVIVWAHAKPLNSMEQIDNNSHLKKIYKVQESYLSLSILGFGNVNWVNHVLYRAKQEHSNNLEWINKVYHRLFNVIFKDI